MISHSHFNSSFQHVTYKVNALYELLLHAAHSSCHSLTTNKGVAPDHKSMTRRNLSHNESPDQKTTSA